MPLGNGELAVLAAVCDRLIPTDEHGPGATEAGVVRYIEQALATDYSARLDAYRAGLARIDSLSHAASGRSLVDLTPQEQDVVLKTLETAEKESDRAFFELVLQHTKEGMFGDPSWGGNAGYAGWKLIGYPGPRHVWTAEEQQLDVVIPPSYSPAEDTAA